MGGSEVVIDLQPGEYINGVDVRYTTRWAFLKCNLENLQTDKNLSLEWMVFLEFKYSRTLVKDHLNIETTLL